MAYSVYWVCIEYAIGWIKAFFIPQISIFQAWKRQIYKGLTESVKNPLAESFHFFPTLRTLHEKQNYSYFKYGFAEYWVAKWKQFVEVFMNFFFFFFKSQFDFIRHGKWFEDVKTKKLKKGHFLPNLVGSISTLPKVFYFRSKFLCYKFSFQEHILILSFRKTDFEYTLHLLFTWDN